MILARCRIAWLLALAPLVACSGPDPLKELEVSDFETYWVVERPVGDTQYIAPAVRVRLRHPGTEPLRYVQLQARFNRVGETEEWGSDWRQVQGREGRALEPGDTAVVTLKPAEAVPGGHYYSQGAPETMCGVRLLGVGVSGLDPAGPVPEPLFPDPEDVRARRRARAADAVRDRLGEDAVVRASQLRREDREDDGEPSEASSLPSVD